MRCLLPLVLLWVAAASAAQPLVPGEAWEPVPIGTSDVRDLQVFPDGTVLAATRGGIQVSGDGGESWGFWLSQSDAAAVSFSPGHALFVGTNGYASRDSTPVAAGYAAAWQSRASRPDRGNLASLAFGGKAAPGARTTAMISDLEGRAWAAVGPGVLHYPGYGTTWSYAELPVSSVLALVLGPTGRLWAGTTDGVFTAESAAYTDAGDWTQAALGGIAVTSVAEAASGRVWARDRRGEPLPPLP